MTQPTGSGWDALDTYRNGLDFFSDVVASVPNDRWTAASPCSEWTALDVLGHVGEATDVGAQILTSDTVDFTPHSPPSGAVVGDPAAWWSTLAERARTALATVADLDREVDSPMGKRTIRDGLSFPAVDLFMHGWDLAAAAGRSVRFPDEAIAFIDAMFATVPEEVTRSPRVFAAAVEMPAGGDDTDRILAYSGRDPRWNAA